MKFRIMYPDNCNVYTVEADSGAKALTNHVFALGHPSDIDVLAVPIGDDGVLAWDRASRLCRTILSVSEQPSRSAAKLMKPTTSVLHPDYEI